MKVQEKLGKVTQNMHGASRNYRYVWDISAWPDRWIVNVALTLYNVRCTEREFIRGWIPALGDYRTGGPEGGIMPEVSWTSDTRVGGVSGLLDLFRTTFVFEISSFRYYNSTGQIIGQMVRGGDGSMLGILEGVVNKRIAYSYSLYFSDQFWCIKFFDPIYGLKDIDFISNQF